MPPSTLPHTDPPAAEPAPSISPLSAIEIYGALAGRVAHDLSSLVGAIAGNAEFAQQAGTDAASIQSAVRAIGVAAHSAAKLLDQLLALQRLAAEEMVPCETTELALIIAESSGLAPGWRVIEPGNLHGEVKIQPRWVCASVWQIARQTGTENGEIEFTCGPAVFPVVWRGTSVDDSRRPELFQITLRYRGELPMLDEEGPTSRENLSLLAACELVRRCRGQIHPRPKPPGRQEVTVLLPLA